MNTTVKDVMTTRVIWVKKDATFREMAAALREYRVSAFPVVDDDRKVIGVVSEADMLTKEALIDEPGFVDGILRRRDQAKARGITAGDLMTTGQIDAKPFITHHFDMDDFEEAYDISARAADTGALKVVLTRESE